MKVSSSTRVVRGLKQHRLLFNEIIYKAIKYGVFMYRDLRGPMQIQYFGVTILFVKFI